MFRHILRSLMAIIWIKHRAVNQMANIVNLDLLQPEGASRTSASGWACRFHPASEMNLSQKEQFPISVPPNLLSCICLVRTHFRIVSRFGATASVTIIFCCLIYSLQVTVISTETIRDEHFKKP